MSAAKVAIVGAAETTALGRIPQMSQIQLHADAALNALADAGLTLKDIDGVATAGESPTAVAHYLGIAPNWVDGTAVGGCSFTPPPRLNPACVNACSLPMAKVADLTWGVLVGRARPDHFLASLNHPLGAWVRRPCSRCRF